MRNTQLLSQNWVFCPGFHINASLEQVQGSQKIELPHNAVDVPLNYFDETKLHQDFTYQYSLKATQTDLSKQLIMHFEGVMCDAYVYVNGKLTKQHSDGYTPFDVHLSPWLQEGDNQITVTLSGRENPAIPPFGGMIDFLCFPGIYRDVNLTRFDEVRVKNVKVDTFNVLSKPIVEATVYLEKLADYNAPLTMKLTLVSAEGNTVASQRITNCQSDEQAIKVCFEPLTEAQLWHPDHPNLYTLQVELLGENLSDYYQCRFGLREAEFRVDGFYLNNERLQLVGVNRHQSYPYAGYAMGKRAQQLDAELAKQKLGFNLIRTSHYPQSVHFLDRCDELGLLVFEEIAGWQHVGDQAWQQKSIDNVRAMIERDWNHPSIILWGVRINESVDSHDFYTQTNALARKLDPSRQTGGVRCIQNSEYLEDVYTMNDFILSDSHLNPNGDIELRSPQTVTGLDKPVPYLVTEYAGHMFPTKRTDCEVWQNEHVMRHLRVLNASFSNPNISGAITWCLFDYNTHRDFGSGDKICYHGVNDAFRVPKFAASVYASQMSPKHQVILSPVTYWTRGERPEAKALPLIILTNCDRVDIQIGDGVCRSFFPDKGRFPNLPHPPVVVDVTNQRDLPVGDWGNSWQDIKFTGYVDGTVCIETELAASPVPTLLDIRLQTDSLKAHCGDTCHVVIKALDQKGQILPYFKDVIQISSSDNLAVIGPTSIPLEGGVASFWVRAFQQGAGEIKLKSSYFGKFSRSILVQHQQVISQQTQNEVQYG